MFSARITLKHVAERAGVHPTTVSMALRNHPQLPEITKSRLQKLAREMGYSPDPVLNALNAYRLKSNSRSFQGVIAWLDATPEGERRSGPYRLYWESAMSRCKELGYILEEFHLKSRSMSGGRLSRILKDRGVQGILVTPLSAGRGHIKMEWDLFSAVSVSYSVTSPALHIFVPDQYAAMADMLRRIRRRQYKKPGLVVNKNEHERTDHQRVAAFLMHQSEVKIKNRIPVLFLDQSDDLRNFRVFSNWVQKYQPDVVIGQQIKIIPWLEDLELRVPEDIGFSAVTVSENDQCSGHKEDVELVSKTAIDWLSIMIQHGERGVPARKIQVKIPGTWSEGSTLRPPLKVA